MRSLRHNERGSSLIEGALMLPMLFLLFFGMIEIGRACYTYYMLQRVLTTVARYAGTQQGINFCDETDASLTAAKNFALRGTVDATATPLLAGLETDNITVRVERVDSATGTIGECECAVTGCDAGQGGRSPDFIVVSLQDGYPIRLAIPFLSLDPIPLRPQVRMPFGGT